MKKLAVLLTLCVLVMGVSAQAAETFIRANDVVSATYYYHNTDPVTWHGNYFGQEVKNFWKFPLATLAAEASEGNSIQINSATLILICESSYPSSQMPTQTLYQVQDNNWEEGFTIENAPQFNDAITTFGYTDSFGGIYVDVKDYLQSRLDSDATHIAFGGYGISPYVDEDDKNMFRMVSLGYGYDEHYAPKIIIDYTVVPEPVTLITLALGGLALVRRKK